MPKNPYTLGTENASNQLLRDLYIDLRAKANFWSALTKQTPQARMGYIGLWELARGKNCGIIALSHSKIFLKEEILLDNEKIPLRSEVPEAET